MADGWRPRYLVLHDYGGTPRNADGVFNPYHALVFPDGSIRYRYPSDPYGQTAPHAFRMNPESIGLSYAGQVGSTPTPEAMATLRSEYGRIRERFPGIEPLGHGEAYARTRGTPQQASRDGRDLVEASWRANLASDAPASTPQLVSGPTPIRDRGITTRAGLSRPMALGSAPSPSITEPDDARALHPNNPAFNLRPQIMEPDDARAAISAPGSPFSSSRDMGGGVTASARQPAQPPPPAQTGVSWERPNGAELEPVFGVAKSPDPSGVTEALRKSFGANKPAGSRWTDSFSPSIKNLFKSFGS